jgi:predicted neuraminidase
MLKRVLSALCTLCLFAEIFSLQREEVVISEQFLSPAWEKYDCHSSSLVQTSEGKILAVWKGGFGEGKSNFDIDSNVGIWQTYFDGNQWADAERIHFEEESVVWNPVLARSSTHEILLFYRVGKAPWGAVAFLKRSSDGRIHWSDPEILPAGIIGPSKNKPIVLKDGTMLCPSSIQAGSPDDQYHVTAVWIDRTQDGGRSWSKSGPLIIPEQPFGVIEPALFFDKQGDLHLLCRDRARRIGGVNGCIWAAVSRDCGKTWGPLEKTALPNPDSGFDVADLGNGNLVLIYNHSTTDRFPLSIAISIDGGKTWERKCDLEKATGEFPAAIVSNDGIIHVTYAYEIESGQRRIKYVALDPRTLFGDQ